MPCFWIPILPTPLTFIRYFEDLIPHLANAFSVVFSPHGRRTCRTVLKTSHFTTDSTYRTDNTGAHESSRAETRSENPRRRSGYPDPWSGSCPKMHLSDGRAIPSFAQNRKIRRQSAWIRIGVDLTCVSRR